MQELLALGERIGNVSTGLSRDTISRYMVETVYYSPNHIEDNEEEDNCVICLVSLTIIVDCFYSITWDC